MAAKKIDLLKKSTLKKGAFLFMYRALTEQGVYAIISIRYYVKARELYEKI